MVYQLTHLANKIRIDLCALTGMSTPAMISDLFLDTSNVTILPYIDEVLIFLIFHMQIENITQLTYMSL